MFYLENRLTENSIGGDRYGREENSISNVFIGVGMMFKKKFQKEEVIISNEDIQIKKAEAKRKRESRNKRNRVNKKIKKL